MAPPTVAEILARRDQTAAFRKRSTRQLSRAERLQLRPREPRAARLIYQRGMERIVSGFKAVALKELLPALGDELRSSSGLVSAPDSPTARTRVDASERLNAIFAFLEVALTEMTGEEQVAPVLEEVAAELFSHNRKEMSRVLSLDLRGENAGLQRFIQDFVRKNVNLVRSVSFQQLDRMENIVAEGTAGQVRVEVLAEQLQKSFNLTDSRAALIARDQTLKANANLTQLRQQQVGVTEYIWTASNDERVRGRPGGKWAESDSDHWRLDGTRQSWLNPPITNPVTGARNHPGEDYQCRCTPLPITEHLLRD